MDQNADPDPGSLKMLIRIQGLQKCWPGCETLHGGIYLFGFPRTHIPYTLLKHRHSSPFLPVTSWAPGPGGRAVKGLSFHIPSFETLFTQACRQSFFHWPSFHATVPSYKPSFQIFFQHVFLSDLYSYRPSFHTTFPQVFLSDLLSMKSFFQNSFLRAFLKLHC